MKKLIVVLIVIFFIASLSFGCKKSVELESSGKLSDAGTEAYQDEELPDSVPWQDAEYYIGKTITVYGPVVDTKHFGAEGEGTTFLYIGKVYPEPKAFTIWIDNLIREKFSQDPKTYYYGKSISVTGLILESNGSPYIEVTDPNQISGGEEIAEIALEEETADETIAEVSEETESVKETVKETEPAGEALTVPTINLEIIEGPAFSQAGDNTCYYRIRANVTGNPSPTVSFNKDDSQGSLGKNIVQVNLHSKGETFTLEATASNTQGSASASIKLTHTCQDHIPIIIQNNTGGSVSINLSGPGSYSFNIAPGQKIIYVIPGTYNYKGTGCGSSTLSGTEDLSSPNFEWKWWCE